MLITGALGFVVEPLRPLFDEIIAAEMAVKPDGTYTGELTDVPPTGETRAQLLADYCDAEGLELAESIAYADSSSDLPMLEAVGFPVAVNPETRLAALARKRGWLVEQWDKAAGGPRPLLPIGPRVARARRRPAMKALPLRAQARALRRRPRRRVARRPARGANHGPLRLADVDPVELPGPGWVRIRPRLAGICGSDLATIDGQSSRYFEPIVSFPFVPGHEVVADTADDRRVVLEPVLGCVARGIDPPCPACARGDLGNCERLAFGHLEPGLQSGFCADTGGGWSTFMVAHESQLHAVPDDFDDDAAVIVEPTACAVHAALRAGVARGRRGGRARRRHPRAAQRRRPAPPSPAPARSWPPPSTPSSAAWPPSSAPTPCASPTRCPASCAASPARWPTARSSPAAPTACSTASAPTPRSSRAWPW